MRNKFTGNRLQITVFLAAAAIALFVAPATASAAPTASIRAGQNDTFTATANGTNLSKIDIYRTPTGYASWTYMGTGFCSGSTCSYSVSWDPSSSGTRNWYFVVNAFDSTGQCTGNPWTSFPNPTWSDCGANDYTGMTPPAATNPAGSCPSPGSTANLSWIGASGASRYDVYAFDLAYGVNWGSACGSNGRVVCSPVTGTSYSFSTTAGNSYQWFTFACNSWGCSAPASYSTSFTCTLPNCNTSISCGGSCSAAANTCSTNNGSRGSCVYTTYSGGGSCTQVSAPNQACTINNCSSGYTCISGSCVAPPPAPTNPSNSCPAPGTTASLSWTGSSGATRYDVFAFDLSYGSPNWSACGSNGLVVCQQVTSGTSYSFATTPGKNYQWFVFACNSAGCSTPASYSTTFTCTPPPPPPPNPTNPSASCSIPGTNADFSWSGVSGATRYDLYVYNTADAWSWATACTPPNYCEQVFTTSKSLGSRVPGANYNWWLFACNDSGCSSGLLNSFPCIPTPGPPTASITGSSSGIIGQSLSFTATGTGTNLTSIQIWRSPKDIQSWTNIASGSCSGSTCSLTGSWTPTAGDAKDWYVVANAYDAYSQQCTGNPWTSFPNPTWSNCGSSDNITTTVKLPAPTNPAGSCPIPGTTASLRWTGVSGASRYDVYVQDLAYGSLNWNTAQCGQNGLVVCQRVYGTSYSTSNLTPGNNYQWYVYACIGEGSNCSDAASYSTTFTCIPPPAPPTPTAVVNSSCTSGDTSNDVTISWASSNPAVTYIDISENNFATWYNKSVGGSTSTTASSGFNGFTPSGISGPLTLKPNTTYSVRAWNGYRLSGTSTFTTPKLCPPTNPTASCPVPGTTANLSWIGNSGATRYDVYVFDLAYGSPNWSAPCGSNGRVVCQRVYDTRYSFSSTLGKSYQWFVFACVGDGNNCSDAASYSTTFSCTLTPPPTPTPAPTPPPTTPPNCGGGTPVRAEGLVTTPLLTGKFTTSGRCVAGNESNPLNEVAFAPFKIPSYGDLKSLYYTQAKSTKKTEITPSSGTANQGTLRSALNNYDIILIKGDLDINANLGGAPKTAVVFVDGNLSFSGGTFIFGDANSGIVFVVGGNVIIDQSVTQIDAVIISAGKIYTAGFSCSSNSPVSANQLVINGSLIALDQANKIEFCRTLGFGNNTSPAEKINHQVKYLVILRDLYADTMQKWSEIP